MRENADNIHCTDQSCHVVHGNIKCCEKANTRMYYVERNVEILCLERGGM
jgi:hypothetical protein